MESVSIDNRSVWRITAEDTKWPDSPGRHESKSSWGTGVHPCYDCGGGLHGVVGGSATITEDASPLRGRRWGGEHNIYIYVGVACEQLMAAAATTTLALGCRGSFDGKIHEHCDRIRTFVRTPLSHVRMDDVYHLTPAPSLLTLDVTPVLGRHRHGGTLVDNEVGAGRVDVARFPVKTLIINTIDILRLLRCTGGSYRGDGDQAYGARQESRGTR